MNFVSETMPQTGVQELMIQRNTEVESKEERREA
jgi:hypothetical protein